MIKNFLITDSSKKINILWETYDENENQISLLNYIERNSELIKKKYLTLIDEIGFFQINKKCLHEIFLLEKNFSFWWTTDIYEKSIYKQDSINEILKIFAFIEIIKLHQVDKIVIKNFPKKYPIV